MFEKLTEVTDDIVCVQELHSQTLVVLGEVENWSELVWEGLTAVLKRLPLIREKVRGMSHCISDCWTQLDNTQRLLSTLTEVPNKPSPHNNTLLPTHHYLVNTNAFFIYRPPSGAMWSLPPLRNPNHPLLCPLSHPSLHPVFKMHELWPLSLVAALCWTCGPRPWSVTNAH